MLVESVSILRKCLDDYFVLKYSRGNKKRVQFNKMAQLQDSAGKGKQVRLRRVGVPRISKDELGNLNNVAPTKQVILKRIGNEGTTLVSKQKRIEENLKNLELNTQKKRIAQAIYYGGAGQSPLTRNSLTVAEDKKRPVHSRLGNAKQVRLRRIPLVASNNRIIKTKYRRPNLGIRRLLTAQTRIHKIRQQQLLQQQGVFIAKQNIFRNDTPKKIRLQRTRTDSVLNPTNFMIEVKNKTVRFGDECPEAFMKHSPLGALDPKLQAQIKFLQKNSARKEPIFIPCEPIHVEGTGCTRYSLHERFSLI